MSGGGTIAFSGTRAEALTVQSSTAGMTIPWLRGMHRVPANLLWYGDFKAISTYEKTGGKGGSPSIEKVTYKANLIMGLCHGVAADIPRVWKGKGVTTPGALGMTVFSGTLGQAVWGPLIGKGNVAIGYSGIVGLAAFQYGLGESASVENHSVEVRHSSAYSVNGSVPDADPAVFTAELLTDTSIGAGIPASMLGDWSQWSDYCRGADLLMSPLLTTQVSASDALEMVAKLTNTAIVWSGGKLRMVPYGDTALTANGRTYTPDLTPVYEFDTNTLLAMGMPAIKARRLSPADRFNEVPVQYKNRDADYAVDVVRAKDLTDIGSRGLRTMDTIEADWICRGSVARQVAELLKQRSLLVVREYEIQLPWHFALIECMDILLLTDPRLQLDKTPVRVKQIVEESDETLTLTCEDFPAGVASAPLYAVQGNSGFAHNANVAPGNALAPVIFELPGALTTTGLELGIATGSADPNWGGCQVWVSYDGSEYRQLTELRGGSRFGTLNSDSGSSLSVNINAGQQLLSGSATDAARLATLCYLAPYSSVAGEYIAHQESTLASAGVYTLSHLVRGAYGTSQAAHAAGTPFVRVDDAVARTGALDPALIGKTVYVKLCSFNVFGAAVQSLADVAATAYTITGAHYVSPSATLSIKINANDFAGNLNPNECWIHGRDASGVPVDAPGVVLVNGQPRSVPNGLLFGSQGPYSGYIVWDKDGVGGFNIASPANANYPYVACRRYGAQWQYDDNTAWVNFTPGASHVVIGTIQSAAPDTNTMPGILTATMWAHASSLDSLVANAALPSVRVRGDNLNANIAGFSGRGVTFSTGFSDSSGGRGHTLTVYDPATDHVTSAPTTYDTYAAGTAGLVTALSSIPVGRIITLYTNDASMHDAALRDALVPFGGSGSSLTWASDRVSHAFVGQRGLAPGQAFEAISSAADATGVVNLQAYYSISGLVSNGAAGSTGLTNALVYIYQRSATGAPALPSATATYVFATAALTGLNNGWSATPPAGTDPLYMSVATASSSTGSDTIASGEWASVVLLAANGANGTNGTNGMNGSNGADGVNAATVYLFQRTAGAAAPSLPSVNVTYNFSTGAASGMNNGWSQTLPTSGGAYRWVTTASALSVGSTDIIAPSEWAAAALLAQDGSNGADGANGQDAVAMTLSAASVTLQADSTGVVSDYGPASTTAKVMRGATDDTANWSFSRANSTGVTSSLSGATLTVSAMSADTGYVDVTATRSGYASQTARFTLAKAKSARPNAGVVQPISHYSESQVTSPANPLAYLRIYADGTWEDGTNWYYGGSPPAGLYVRADLTQVSASGSTTGTFGSWIQISTNYAVWSLTRTTVGGATAFVNLTFATDSAGANVVASGVAQLSVIKDAP